MRVPSTASAVADFLRTAAVAPAALVIEGEPGIGKTTLLSDALAQARVQGFRVLSARAAAAESVRAYGTLADLLFGIAAPLSGLPRPQRIALDQVLPAADRDRVATDQRAVAAGFLSVIEGLAEETPVLVAIDDLQWLDPSSVAVVAFAARRLAGRIGMLATVRTDPDGGGTTSWLQLPRPDQIARIQVAPLSAGGVHAVVSQHLGRSLPRPTIVRIHQVSGGNPFYAVELARSLNEAPGADVELPDTLADLVRARIGRLDPSGHDALLATASLASPTVELVAGALRTGAEHVGELLADAEGQGIITITGHRIDFAHPLLAMGVYTNSTPAQRRTMHRHLAGIISEPELAARHLALATTSADPQTLRSLDAAAESARRRGAPAAAAELLDLAIGLGGDTPARRIALAGHHLDAGDLPRARTLLEDTIDSLVPGVLRAEASSLLGFLHLFGDSFLQAASVLEGALDEAGDHLGLRTRLLIALSYARYNAGRFGAASRSIEDAVTHAERLGQPHLLSQALSMRVVLRFLRGEGLDEACLSRALELEDHDAAMPMAFRPTMQNAMLLGWAGKLDRAHQEMAAIRRRCIESGEENELIFVAVHSALVEIWRGDFAEAALIAEDTEERAAQLGGDVPMFVAMTIRASVAAFAGREEAARHDTREALTASELCGANLLVVWTLTTLGFLEASLGNAPGTLAAVGPLLSRLDAAPDATEIPAASFVPDAVEALVRLGRLDEAEPLAKALERNGARLERSWMVAVGARCRAMLLAARGDLDAAALAAQHAIAEHEHLPMPFEKARTQLLLGQLQRTQRHKTAATANLQEALDTFEELNIPLWAERARAELFRITAHPRLTAVLTPAEQRVATLAASGMTNRDVAAALYISPKTVEANLARVYRKLGIRSRAELGGWVGHLGP